MTSIMRQKDLRPAPALIEFKGMKFLITDRPSDITINHYITVSKILNQVAKFESINIFRNLRKTTLAL